jgi:Flp pilus assembly pilin Flp
MLDRLAAWATTRTAPLGSDGGQTFVEYALILAVVVVATLMTITFTGLASAIQGAVTQVINSFAGA